MIIIPNYHLLNSLDCGPICILIISKNYGRNFSLQGILLKCFITRQGVSMQGISDPAELIVFIENGVLVILKHFFIENPLLCMLYRNQNYFLAYNGIKQLINENYEIRFSPSKGEKYTLLKGEFINCMASSRTEREDTGTIMRRIGDNDRVKSFLTSSTLTTMLVFIISDYYNLSILEIFLVGNKLYTL